MKKWEHCKSILINALNFLTGDHWAIHFRERVNTTDDENKYIKGRWRYRRSVRKIDSDIILHAFWWVRFIHRCYQSAQRRGKAYIR